MCVRALWTWYLVGTEVLIEVVLNPITHAARSSDGVQRSDVGERNRQLLLSQALTDVALCQENVKLVLAL